MYGTSGTRNSRKETNERKREKDRNYSMNIKWRLSMDNGRENCDTKISKRHDCKEPATNSTIFNLTKMLWHARHASKSQTEPFPTDGTQRTLYSFAKWASAFRLCGYVDNYAHVQLAFEMKDIEGRFGMILPAQINWTWTRKWVYSTIIRSTNTTMWKLTQNYENQLFQHINLDPNGSVACATLKTWIEKNWENRFNSR